MNVYIGNFPGEATIYELENFLGGVKIHSVIKNSCEHDIEQPNSHSFVIYTEDDSTRNSLIKRFNGQKFHGRIVEAREHIPC